MYANYYSSNNPFVEDPNTAHARFPDLTTSAFQPSTGYPSQHQQYQPQYHPHPSQSYVPNGPYLAQTQQIPSQSHFAYAPQYPAQGQTGPQPTGNGTFQPTTGFAPQYPIAPSYPFSGASYQQMTTAVPTYLAEFDPYSQTTRTTPPQAGPVSQGATGPPGVSHPRDLIRIYKSGLEAWDSYSWKQLFSACDVLKEAWSARKQQAEVIVRQYGGHADPGLFGPDPAFGYNSQIEGWKQVLKDANDNFDTVAASTFQLHEVFNSYRQSGDLASKRRVRESCNAAVKGLPDWPSN